MKRFLFFLIFVLLNQNLLCHQLGLSFFKENVYYSLKTDSLLELKDIFGINVFIETGTFNGESSIRAARIFDKVYTVELRKDHYDIAFNNLAIFNNVQCFLGDSSVLLSTILRGVSKKKILFWLDACDDAYTPIVQELESIAGSGCKNGIILVDDMQAFNSPDYPSIGTLVQAIKSINSAYNIVMCGDILLAYPNDTKSQVSISPVLDACTVSRLYDEGFQNISIKDLIKKEFIIGRAQGVERDTINDLAAAISHDTHYLLWRALVSYCNGEFEKSINDLDAIIYGEKLFYKNQRVIHHWRLWFYKVLAAEKLGNSELTECFKQLNPSCDGFSYRDFKELITAL